MTLPNKSFYFIRHGETDWNKDKIIMGHTDIPLNQNGFDQAYRAQKFFKNMSFDKIYTSPLKRAYRTAEILNECIGSSLVTCDDLMERGFGERDGTSYDGALTTLSNTSAIKGAETFDVFEARVLTGVRKILEESKSSPLIVAHGGVFVVLAKYCGASPDLRAQNCQPFLFRSPQHPTHPWFICDLIDGEDNIEEKII